MESSTATTAAAVANDSAVFLQQYPCIMFGLAAVELLVNLVCVPVSAINFFLIVKTSVIHLNLKRILLFQSGCILGRGMCRFTVCLLKFALLDPMGSEYLQPISTAYSFFIFARNCVVHVLIIERVLATLAVKSYERRRKPFFTFCWLVAVLALSLYNSIGYEAKGLSNVLTNVALLFTAAIELCLFWLLRMYSERAYSHSLHNVNGRIYLSERYQLSENIRIGKQLVPTLVFHLFNIMSSTFVTTWYYLDIPAAQYAMVTCAAFSSLCSLMIEIAIIMYNPSGTISNMYNQQVVGGMGWALFKPCHPFLKRDFTRILNRFNFMTTVRPNRVSQSVAARNGGTKIAMTNILNGQALVIEQKPEQHFKMLSKMWN